MALNCSSSYLLYIRIKQHVGSPDSIYSVYPVLANVLTPVHYICRHPRDTFKLTLHSVDQECGICFISTQ